MLLSRTELTHDFGGARFDPARDHRVLGWVFNQLLYGRITGVRGGRWLPLAPDVDAARFLARRAAEDLVDVERVLQCLRRVGARPSPAHFVTRALAGGGGGGDWAGYLTLRVLVGESLTLPMLYGLVDTVPDTEVRERLEAIAAGTEAHVDFAERRVLDAVESRPGLRRRLLGRSLPRLWLLEDLAGPTARLVPDHPILTRLPDFLRTVLRGAELRLLRMRLLDRPLSALGAGARSRCIAGAWASDGLEGVMGLPRRLGRGLTGADDLPARYMRDPSVRRYLLTVVGGGDTEAA